MCIWGYPNVYAAKRMRYDALGYGMSCYQPCFRIESCEMSLTIFIHNYKNRIILRINIDFHY